MILLPCSAFHLYSYLSNLFLPILGDPVGVSVTVFIEFIGDIDEINMV